MGKPKNKGNNLGNGKKKRRRDANPAMDQLRKQTHRKKKEIEKDEEEMEGLATAQQGNNVRYAPYQRRKRKGKNTLGMGNKENQLSQGESIVQIRHRVSHKKMFYWIEQLMLKNSLNKKIKVNKVHDDAHQYGMDFIFGQITDAQRFAEFVESILPVLSKKFHRNERSVNYTIEIPPLYKDHLICLPQKLYNSMQGFGPLVVCYKIDKNICLVDPQTLNIGKISAHHYFEKEKFNSLSTPLQFTEYSVLDIMGGKRKKKGNFTLGEVQICRTSQLGENQETMDVKCHFVDELTVGDVVYGYDITSLNTNDKTLSDYKKIQIPDVVLVRKQYESIKKREWHLDSWYLSNDTEEYDELLDEIENNQYMKSTVDIQINEQVKKNEMEVDNESTETTKTKEKDSKQINEDTKGKIMLEDIMNELELSKPSI